MMTMISKEKSEAKVLSCYFRLIWKIVDSKSCQIEASSFFLIIHILERHKLPFKHLSKCVSVIKLKENHKNQ